MVRNVRFTWEQRLGNVGESEIKGRLSYFSTVTKIEDDVGLDFYCELLEHDSPTNEFYIQAKSTEYFNENWTANIKKSTILYWLWKPNPVYIIVYDEPAKNCYWMTIEDMRYELFDKLFKTNTDSVNLKFDNSKLLKKGKDLNEDFIKKMKDDKASIEQFKGQPTLKGDGYVRQLPGAPRNEHEFIQTRENIRVSLYSLVSRYISHNDLQTARLYCEFLAQFDPTGHYNHFVWLGQINLALGDKTLARKSLEQALWICENDPNWPKESVDSLKNQIRQLIRECV
jgi:tetratricopeptide (TPR) repeat protein